MQLAERFKQRGRKVKKAEGARALVLGLTCLLVTDFRTVLERTSCATWNLTHTV